MELTYKNKTYTVQDNADSYRIPYFFTGPRGGRFSLVRNVNQSDLFFVTKSRDTTWYRLVDGTFHAVKATA